MKTLKELLATITNAPDPVIELERALAELETAHAAVIAELDGLSGTRQKALEDGDDAALAVVLAACCASSLDEQRTTG